MHGVWKNSLMASSELGFVDQKVSGILEGALVEVFPCEKGRKKR
jgi:hypothetical protein